eukprot:2160334-Amphidinium_carterae.1
MSLGRRPIPEVVGYALVCLGRPLRSRTLNPNIGDVDDDDHHWHHPFFAGPLFTNSKSLSCKMQPKLQLTELRHKALVRMIYKHALGPTNQ